MALSCKSLKYSKRKRLIQHKSEKINRLEIRLNYQPFDLFSQFDSLFFIERALFESMHYSSDDLVVVKFSRNPTPKKDELSSDKIRTKNKSKSKKPKSFWLRHVVEFFRTTGLHGYKYIIMEDTPFIEKYNMYNFYIENIY